jgi:transcriptional regulator with XRE-family HTH domain
MATRLSLGVLILAYRKQARLTQKQLGDQVGCSADRIAHIESGRTRLPAEEAPAFAKALGCDVSDLLQEAEEEPIG